MITKICNKCKLEKSTLDFSKDSSAKSGLRTICKQCDKETRIRKRLENPDLYLTKQRIIIKKSNLKRLYHITLEEYNNMMNKQNGVCAICGRSELDINQFGSRSLSVDHDHRTGQVRGLLCNRCNRLLGFADDNLELLSKCIKYITG